MKVNFFFSENNLCLFSLKLGVLLSTNVSFNKLKLKQNVNDKIGLDINLAGKISFLNLLFNFKNHSTKKSTVLKIRLLIT